MKTRPNTWKSVALTFVLAAVFYCFAYSWMTRWQTGRGPWLVEFGTNVAGRPQMIITQPALGLSNITVCFEGETLAPTDRTGTVAFSKPRQPTPFGEVIYDDLMRQPGVITLDLFGHEVELIPKHLVLNRHPVGWTNGAVFTLVATNKIPAGTPKPAKGGYRK
jgi:hypothetical protein